MSYDRADWHYGGQGFSEDLAPEAGGVHIGMFLAWAFMNGLEGADHRQESPEAVAAVRRREMTGCQFLFEHCDGKFWSSDLNADGNAFARYYYGEGENPGQYISDYDRTLGRGVPSTYHVQDTWENYDRIAAVIDKRYARWKVRSGRPWWRFW